MARNTVTITDFSQENSSFGYESAALNAGNIVAQTALHVALREATEDVTIGHVSKQGLYQPFLDDPGVPTNPYAQREMKALVTYQGTISGKKFQTEVAAPNLTDTLVPGTDVFNIEEDPWAAWVTAFVGVAKSPDDPTESVIVLGVRLVGRNI